MVGPSGISSFFIAGIQICYVTWGILERVMGHAYSPEADLQPFYSAALFNRSLRPFSLWCFASHEKLTGGVPPLLYSYAA